MTHEEAKPRGWAEKLEKRRESYKTKGKIYRLLFISAGVFVTLAGAAMLVTPGPAFVVIPIGLAMLAMEFAWAESVLEKVLEKAEQAQATARKASPAQKVITTMAILLAVAAAVVAIYAWGIHVPVLNPK